MRATLARIAAHPQAKALRDEEAWTRTWLGRALLAQAKPAEAQPELMRAAQLRAALDAADSIWLAAARRDVAAAQAASGRRTKAGSPRRNR